MVPFLNDTKTHFSKNEKKGAQKKLGGPGGKAPRQARKALRQVNFFIVGGRDHPKNKNWHRFGIDPASIWHRFGIALGSFWDRFGDHRGASGTLPGP